MGFNPKDFSEGFKDLILSCAGDLSVVNLFFFDVVARK